MIKIPMYIALKLATGQGSLKDFVEAVQPVIADQSVVSKLADAYSTNGDITFVKGVVTYMVYNNEYVEGIAE